MKWCHTLAGRFFLFINHIVHDPRNFEALEEGDGFDFRPYHDRGDNIGLLEVDRAVTFFL